MGDSIVNCVVVLVRPGNPRNGGLYAYVGQKLLRCLLSRDGRVD
ncbi:unnamed protein product [Angiostrongylus costaricensis]|uniref:Transposase n=1 Tax=Angiostrongylus costaricensis TaxID=334426 RepID=A0A0R3Q2M6_ANGCS|nr:unnamed protein product [Angiostrongylus costaricensis]